MSQSWRRHEIKYRVRADTLAEFKACVQGFLVADPHDVNGTGYDNYSIYYDSPDLRYCREKDEGLSVRTKPRLRIYKRPEDHAPLAHFFEFKNRNGSAVAKERVAISADTASRLLDPMVLLHDINASSSPVLAKLAYLTRRDNLRPTVCVLYRREALFSPLVNGLRITYDRLLSASSRTELDTPPRLFQPIVPFNETIIEIKYNTHLPTWLTHIVHKLELDRVSVSKYVTAMQSPARGWSQAAAI